MSRTSVKSRRASRLPTWMTGRHRPFSISTICRAKFEVTKTSPRRGEVFVTSNFAKQVAEIEKGLKPPVIHVGNLEAKRDFTDVRDMVRAYWLALEKGAPGDVYNIGSGRAISMREVLDQLLALSPVKVRIKVDPARLRPSDVPILLCDRRKFSKTTGWKPRIPLEATFRDLLDYWRAKL